MERVFGVGDGANPAYTIMMTADLGFRPLTGAADKRARPLRSEPRPLDGPYGNRPTVQSHD
eukprot:549710-Pyramimonas_sp.AAC.1